MVAYFVRIVISGVDDGTEVSNNRSPTENSAKVSAGACSLASGAAVAGFIASHAYRRKRCNQ